MNEEIQHVSIGRLIDRERIRGASRMIPEGTDAQAVTDDQIEQLAADIETFRTGFKPNIPKNAIAKSTGYSEAVISDFIGLKYKGNRGQVAIDLQTWLCDEEQRRTRPQTTQFVWTSVAQKIKATASYCLDKSTVGMIYGPDSSGVGKTTALQAIAQEWGHRRCTFCTIDKVAANPTGLLKEICASMHIDDKGTNKARFDRIVKELRGRKHLLIFDQIHNLRGSKEDKPFYILADIWDRTKDTTSQLWCGTADLVKYLARMQIRSSDESLAQLRSRIFPRVDLLEGVRADGGGAGDPLVSIEQIREMFARNKLKLTPGAAKFLMTLANLPDSGSVRLCVQLIDYVTTVGFNLKVIDTPVLKEALKLGMTTSQAELIVHQIDELPMRIAKVG